VGFLRLRDLGTLRTVVVNRLIGGVRLFGDGGMNAVLEIDYAARGGRGARGSFGSDVPDLARGVDHVLVLKKRSFET
jgi:hypothetical protein